MQYTESFAPAKVRNRRDFLLSNLFSRGSYYVWQRNRDSFLALWQTELWPPFVEAVLGLVAFGFGLGAYVQTQVDGMPYLQFIAPGMIMSSVLFVSSFDCMFGTFIRMDVQKTFDAIIATPISIEEVITGEIVWAGTRAGFTGTCVLIVLAILGLTPTPWVLLIPLLAVLAGFMLGSMACIVTSLVSSFTNFNYYITLGVIPMQLFSGIFFPVSRLPENIAWLVNLSPLYPAVQIARNLFTSQITLATLGYLVWIIVLSLIFYSIALVLMRRRLIK